MKDIHYKSITDIALLLKTKQLSPVELTKNILFRINKIDERLNSFITILEKQALRTAQKAESEIMKGDYRGPLHGIPISLKDMIYVKDVKLTAGAHFSNDFIPETNATVVNKLIEAGAIIVGKLNMDEFSFGVTNETSHYGEAKNPWNMNKVTGGSSGGAGAAVSAGLSFGSIASDTGGSIRIPAALTGVYGLKPTYGIVSSKRTIPLAESLDHIGPMARSAEDLQILFQSIVDDQFNQSHKGNKHNPNESLCIRNDLTGLKIGLPKNFFFDFIEPCVERETKKAIQKLEELGGHIVEININNLERVLTSQYKILRAEAAFYHNSIRDKGTIYYSNYLKEQIDIGNEMTAVQYISELKYKREIKREFERLFNDVDVIVAPSVIMEAPNFAEKHRIINGEQLNIAREFVRISAPANQAGIPSLSIPIGFSERNLPIGLQIMGNHFNDATLLNIAKIYEQQVGYMKNPPI